MNSKNPIRAVAAGMIGNVLEWYDFAIYGYFAVAIGRNFFPHESAVAQLLAAFGVFAVGYLMRPVGGIIVGHIGDSLGRRAALVFSVTAMAVPTVLIGLLPGYAVLGIMAPVILIALRMIQGLAVGGEYPSSVVFLVEHAPGGRRGLMGAFAFCGAAAGILLGSAVGAAFAAIMPADALDAWGWRIPFLSGAIVAFAGYALRRHMADVAAEACERPPIVETIRDHGWLVGRFAALSVFNAVTFYVSFVFIVSWLQTADGMPPARALEINTFNMALLIPLGLAVGWLTDRIGRKPCLIAATLLGLVGALPLYWVMHHESAALVLLGQFGFVLMVVLFNGVQPLIMAETAPAHIRCTAVALGYNISLGVVGGLSPLAATWLIERTGDELAPAFLIMAAAAISLLATLRFPETYRMPLTTGAEAAAAAR
jgi:MHS family proline/betaine transporter-like MFS transporter